jgi:phosphate starvation-inducible protein PhoH
LFSEVANSEQIFNMTSLKQNTTQQSIKQSKTNKKILKNKIKKNRVKAKHRQQTKYTHSCNRKRITNVGGQIRIKTKKGFGEV